MNTPPSRPPARTPPRFVPTLTEVVPRELRPKPCAWQCQVRRVNCGALVQPPAPPVVQRPPIERLPWHRRSHACACGGPSACGACASRSSGAKALNGCRDVRAVANEDDRSGARIRVHDHHAGQASQPTLPEGFEEMMVHRVMQRSMCC
jgi:hypothetical protein